MIRDTNHLVMTDFQILLNWESSLFFGDFKLWPDSENTANQKYSLVSQLQMNFLQKLGFFKSNDFYADADNFKASKDKIREEHFGSFDRDAVK